MTKLEPLAPEHLDGVWHLFSENQERLLDLTVDLWVEEPVLFWDHFEPIARGLTSCQAYVIIDGGTVIGFIDSSTDSQGTRIGYVIAHTHEGRGIMQRHLAEVVGQLPSPVTARILNTNSRSERLVERLGFQRDDTSLHHDHYLWRLK